MESVDSEHVAPRAAQSAGHTGGDRTTNDRQRATRGTSAVRNVTDPLLRRKIVESCAKALRDRGYPLARSLREIHTYVDTNMPDLEPAVTTRITRDIFAYRTSTDATAAGADGRLITVQLHEYLTDEPKPRRWLIPGFLPSVQRVALTGKPSSGKTWLALDAALAVAFGTPFLGRTDAAERGNVVILDAEGGRERAVERFKRLAQARGVALPSATTIHWGSAPGLNLAHGPSVETLRRELSEIKPRLVIFDTLAKVMGLYDENSNAGAARVTAALCALSQERECTLLTLAHPAKSDEGAETIRGAGELSADMDVLWTIRPGDGDIRTVRCHKDRDGELDGNCLGFAVGTQGALVTLSWHEIEETQPQRLELIADSVLKMLQGEEGAVTASAIMVRMRDEHGVGRSTVYNALNALERSELVTSPQWGHWARSE